MNDRQKMPRYQPDLKTQGLWYSLRRYYVDEFYFRHVPTLSPHAMVLDLGGHKIHKRGQFNIERYDMQVIYLNLSTQKGTDVRADVAHMPFRESCFGSIICSEVLELVPSPLAVLHEIYPRLTSGGVLLICVPFLYRIQADPCDYGRYTDLFWQEHLSRIGYNDIQIEWQGSYWSVLADMLRYLVYQMNMEGRPKPKLLRKLLIRAVMELRRHAVKWDCQLRDGTPTRFTQFLMSYTTGFGIRAIKP